MLFFRYLSVLLLAAVAVGQATPAPAPKPRSQTGASAQDSKPAKDAGEVTPSTPVITIEGICQKTTTPPKAAAGSAAKAGCKTVITKSEFESLADALQPPHMNPATRRRLADAYPRILLLADAAHKRGLDTTPSFKRAALFYRQQILAQLFMQSVKEKADQVPDPEIQKYYADNAPEFEQAGLQRLFVPKDKQTEPATSEKPAESAEQKKASEDALKKEADTLHDRAAAGEDFDKLQKEAYDSAELKGTPPQTGIGKLTRNELPVTHRTVLDMKPGEVSQVISEPNGYYVYKLLSKDVKPLESVKAEIRAKLAQQKFQDEMQSIENSAKVEINDAYFGKPPAPGMPGMPAGATRPGQPPAPPQVTPAPQHQPQPAPPTRDPNPKPESPKE